MNILLISGHGAGDPGAVSTINGKVYKEADEARKVTSALKEILEDVCNVTVYPTARNAYKDHKTGILQDIAKFSKYDYVLEIHFNASKESPVDGKTKGVECYVTSSEKSTAVEQKICRYISQLGLTNRNVKRYNWSVISAARHHGTSSALLEVCFIDDPDDMKIYIEKFDLIVKAIADAIIDVFSLVKPEEVDELKIYKKLSDIPSWGQATIQKLLKKGYIKGTGDDLNIEENMLRVLIINDRAGLYDLK